MGNNIVVQYTNGRRFTYELLTKPYCTKCAFPNTSENSCIWKHHHNDILKRIYALGCYYKTSTNREFTHHLSAHIMGAKRYRSYTNYLGAAMACGITEVYKELSKVDFIIPVPYYDSKDGTELQLDKQDGTTLYDQVEEMTKVISERTGLKMIQPLTKTRMQSMHDLENDDERFEEAENLFKCNTSETIKGKRLLLIDDISTSGATLYGCALALQEAKPKEISAYVAGRAIGD